MSIKKHLSQITLHRLHNPIFKTHTWRPAKLVFDLGGINRVANIVSLSILNIADRTLILSHMLENKFCYLKIAVFIVSSNIIDTS